MNKNHQALNCCKIDLKPVYTNKYKKTFHRKMFLVKNKVAIISHVTHI